MKSWIVVAAILIVLLILSILIRLRSKKKSGTQGALKHPQGFKKYHSETHLHVKKAFESTAETPSVAVVAFKGDLKASGRHALSHIFDEIILNREDFSEVVLKVESPGGSVMEYGHVFGEVCRLREAGISVTACVDTVAASGGYLMSIPANKILAAPFAFIGSIGVVSFIPNIRKLLERFDIQPRTFTAGDYKRTVTLTDNATPDDIAHYQEQLQLIHDQFKRALKQYRPNVKLEEVATGEAWLASTTVDKNLGLIDGVRLSSDYLLELNKTHDLVEFSEKEKKKGLLRNWLKFFGISGANLMSKAFGAQLR